MNNKKLWLWCKITMIVLMVLTFTPLVIPQGRPGPFLLGMPYTLWMGILWSVILLAVIILGSIVHPGRQPENK